jgi:hypothetical protein
MSLAKTYFRPVYTKLQEYLEDSPYPGGEKVGRLPRSMELQELRDLGGPQTPIRAIRAKCLDCCGGNAAEVRKCTAVGCALWPFRMGHNPFYGKTSETEADEAAVDDLEGGHVAA